MIPQLNPNRFELLPSVSPADYEAMIALASASGIDRPGMVFHFVKADRGERKGRYAFLFEFEDVAARNRLCRVGGGGTPDEALAEKLKVLLAGMGELPARCRSATTFTSGRTAQKPFRSGSGLTVVWIPRLRAG